MVCKDVEEILAETGPEGFPPPLREHVAGCPGCGVLVRDWRLVRAGFLALAQEPAPEASWGFAARLVRRLQEARVRGGMAADFFERAGRRVVFATLLLALTALIGLALPSSGPLRGPATPEAYLAPPENTVAENEILRSYDPEGVRDAIPVDVTDSGEQKQK